MEPLLTSYAIGIATNAAVAAVVQWKIQRDNLKEEEAEAFRQKGEQFEEFEEFLRPKVEEVFREFEVVNELNDFLVSDTFVQELRAGLLAQAEDQAWSRERIIDSLTIPDLFGLMPELEEFIDRLITAIQRSLADDEQRWNESVS